MEAYTTYGLLLTAIAFCSILSSVNLALNAMMAGKLMAKLNATTTTTTTTENGCLNGTNAELTNIVKKANEYNLRLFTHYVREIQRNMTNISSKVEGIAKLPTIRRYIPPDP